MKPPAGSTETEPYIEQSISSGGAQPSAKDLFQQRKNYAKTVASMGEISDYRVEHLVTFSMERKEAILTVDDSIRKLQLLDARGKVWTQEIILKVDDKSVKLVDIETKDELEDFPLSSLQHIQSVIDACSYNSICAIVVKSSDQKTPDIHLFQCSSVPADVICADIGSAFQDIKSKKGRKSRPDTLRRHRETIEASTRPPANPPINVKDRVAEWTEAIEAQNEASALLARSSLNGQAENTPEIQAFKIHRDVQMLNHALDDIELFVSHLQKSAEANRELTVRQSKKKSKRSKGKAPGSGLMELRARLPPQEHFVASFQKFRFCFNLLAKLKSHIKDPNSVELTHFLFKPLNMIIETCCGPELARTIKTPLLFKDTIEFLRNCGTTEELQLWYSLGEFWTRSKSDFPKEMFFPPYVPTFSSGWVPPPIPSMESEANQLAAAIQGQADHVQRAEEAWKAGGAHIEDALKPLSLATPPESISPRRQSFYDGRKAPKSFKQQVENHVARNQAAQFSPPVPAPVSPPRKLCRAMYDFTARNEHELSVQLDELLDVMDDSKSWWKVQNQNGQSGFVPADLMLLISSATKSTDNVPSSSIYHPPPAPPPPPPPPPPAPAFVSPSAAPAKPVPQMQPASLSAAINNVVLKKSTPTPKRANFDNNSLQAELRQRVSVQKQRNFVLPKKTPTSTNSLSITESSQPRQVEQWLQSLGFSDITVSSLGVLTGAQIFTLSKDELREICDDEGPRVYSQLMVQRALASHSNGNELGRIMKLRREVVPNY